MTMSGFLLLLVKMNLAMGAAIVLASLIRRPLRAQFGAPIAYAIWLLVPIASVASLLPPREVPAPALVATVKPPSALAPVTGHVPHSPFRTTEQLAQQSAIVLPTPVKPLGSSYDLSGISQLLFAAWALGALFMAAYLVRVQIRFSAAVRLGRAGPAVLGFFSPRIVTPDSFQEQFTPQEQAAILAHESVHLARQDARINALVALLRCL
jgi:beta-lactamase regulating signal transducer with metallopeptidase domain